MTDFVCYAVKIGGFADKQKIKQDHPCLKSLHGNEVMCLQVESDVQLRSGFKRVYNKALAANLVQMYKKNAKVFTDSPKPFKHKQAANAYTIRAWDDAIQTAAYGWKDADEYYAGSSSANHVASIKVPTLCIQVHVLTPLPRPPPPPPPWRATQTQIHTDSDQAFILLPTPRSAACINPYYAQSHHAKDAQSRTLSLT